MPHKDKIGKVTRQQVREIAQTKLLDLTADTLDAAMRIDRRHRAQHGYRGRG